MKDYQSQTNSLKHDARVSIINAARARKDEQFYLENYLKIETEDNEILSFSECGGLRKAQRKLLSLIHHQKHVWKCPVRNVIVKSRQIGLSTIKMGCQYIAAKNGANTAVIAHDLKAAEWLFEKFERFHSNDTIDKPELKRSNVRQMIFDGRPGRAEVSTSASPDALRSRTLQDILGSEAAYWGEDGPVLHKAIMKFVGRRLNTDVTYETTANGQDPLIYPMWQNAENYCILKFIDEEGPYGFRIERTITNEKLWNGFHPLFISVLDDERAYLELKPGEKISILQTLDKEENWLLSEVTSSLEFIKWRRWAIAKLCEGDIHDFNKEYPVTAKLAFSLPGTGRFNQQQVNQMPVKEPALGRFQASGAWRNDIVFVADSAGPVQVWDTSPDPTHRFVVSVDPSGGGEPEKIICPLCGGEPDNTSIHVIDIDHPAGLRQVANIYGPYAEEQCAEWVYLLADFYNLALIVVETVGGYGNTILGRLEKSYPPERIFVSEGKKEPGLMVHELNRNGLIADLADTIEAGRMIVHSKITQHQLLNFKRSVRKRDGRTRYEAASGHHDDDVMSLCGAVTGAKNYPNWINPVPMTERGRFGQVENMSVARNPDPEGFY